MKTYTHEFVSFGFKLAFRKWSFEAGPFTYLAECPGGITTARKLASVICGALKRTKGNGLDELGRAGIRRLTTAN